MTKYAKASDIEALTESFTHKAAKPENDIDRVAKLNGVTFKGETIEQIAKAMDMAGQPKTRVATVRKLLKASPSLAVLQKHAADMYASDTPREGNAYRATMEGVSLVANDRYTAAAACKAMGEKFGETTKEAKAFATLVSLTLRAKALAEGDADRADVVKAFNKILTTLNKKAK